MQVHDMCNCACEWVCCRHVHVHVHVHFTSTKSISRKLILWQVNNKLQSHCVCVCAGVV